MGAGAPHPPKKNDSARGLRPELPARLPPARPMGSCFPPTPKRRRRSSGEPPSTPSLLLELLAAGAPPDDVGGRADAASVAEGTDPLSFRPVLAAVDAALRASGRGCWFGRTCGETGAASDFPAILFPRAPAGAFDGVGLAGAPLVAAILRHALALGLGDPAPGSVSHAARCLDLADGGLGAARTASSPLLAHLLRWDDAGPVPLPAAEAAAALRSCRRRTSGPPPSAPCLSWLPYEFLRPLVGPLVPGSDPEIAAAVALRSALGPTLPDAAGRFVLRPRDLLRLASGLAGRIPLPPAARDLLRPLGHDYLLELAVAAAPSLAAEAARVRSLASVLICAVRGCANPAARNGFCPSFRLHRGHGGLSACAVPACGAPVAGIAADPAAARAPICFRHGGGGEDTLPFPPRFQAPAAACQAAGCPKAAYPGAASPLCGDHSDAPVPCAVLGCRAPPCGPTDVVCPVCRTSGVAWTCGGRRLVRYFCAAPGCVSRIATRAHVACALHKAEAENVAPAPRGPPCELGVEFRTQLRDKAGVLQLR